MRQLEANRAAKSPKQKYGIPVTIAFALILGIVAFFVLRKSIAPSQMAVGKDVSTVQPKEPIEGSVMVSAAEAIKANIGTIKVEKRALTKDVNVVGTIKIAEPNEHVVSSRTRGRIEHLYVNTTGQFVRKGDALYDYYSPDLLNAEQEYLIAKRAAASGAKNSEGHDHHYLDEGLIQAGKERLGLYGLSEKQIAALETNGVPKSTVTVLAPASGVVLQKLVQEGAYVDEGTSLFQLADLSLVWAEIEIPENAVRFIHDGYPVSISTAVYPSEDFRGKVIFISPVENPESRSITIRVALQNTNGKLRPEMFVSASIHINVGNVLAVPEGAVTRTGTTNYVWIRNSDGSYSNKMVSLGALSSDRYYQILSGLDEGEEVAVSGQFLIESEHQFAQGANPMAGMNMDAGDEKSKSSGEGTGIVRSIDPKRQIVTLDHGNVPGVMSAMTMAYKTSTAKLLDKIKSGDHVKFTLSRNESGEYVISAITSE